MASFTALDLSSWFNANRGNEGEPPPWHPSLTGILPNLPGGKQTFWGLPFRLGPHPQEGGDAPCWIVLGRDEAPLTLPLEGMASHVIFAHFCNTSQRPGEDPEGARPGEVTRPGERLADYVLVYAEGSEHRAPIRRRYEINEPGVQWGQWTFAAVSHNQWYPASFREATGPGDWGWTQTGVGRDEAPARYWVYALENPHPERSLKALRVEPTGADRFAIAGVTLFVGQAHPLRYRRLESFRVRLPDDEAVLPEDLEAEIDLGVIARRRAIPAVDRGLKLSVWDAWLVAEVQGWGEEPPKPQVTSAHTLDITASPAATLRVSGRAVEMASLYEKQRAASADGRVTVELLSPEKTWLEVTVEDASTGKPTPARVHFRTRDGRYLPPYGHRHEVNPYWFQDYGADLILGSTEYAYVPGAFEIELPVGEVYLEMAKGFEYRPVRQRLQIAPGQRELKLRLERPIDLRREGWVTADTHVHFISPTTARLEAAAEGLNLLNLLASQWGDLFTNVGDLTGEMSRVSRDDVIVWVGTENRQHLLGHISLLGGKGKSVFPMTTGGPDESYLGDPVMVSMAEWADRCREREGVVVLPHFPNPLCEAVADIVLGKIDAVEIRYFQGDSLDTFHIAEWYRYLNLGYRVAAVGGTDKMFAGMPVGGVRTYAHLLPGDDFKFENWGKAVRAGRTFTTSGPLLLLTVDGREPGDVVSLPTGGGTVSATVRAQSMVPFHLLEIVANGKVVAQKTAEAGARTLELTAEVRLDASGWVAARCLSRHTLWHVWPVRAAAHTSPVYVEVAESPAPFNAKDAKYLLAILRGGVLWLETLATPHTPEAHGKILGVFRRAERELEARLAADGR